MATVKIVIQKQLPTCNRVRLKPLTSLVAKGSSTTKKTTCCQLNTEGVFWEKSSQRFQQYVNEFSLGWVMKFHSGGVDNVGFRYMPDLLYMPRSVKCLRYHTPLPYCATILPYTPLNCRTGTLLLRHSHKHTSAANP